ncbi:MAG: hypothetical protein ACLFMS_03115 [Halorhodospira sp.]
MRESEQGPPGGRRRQPWNLPRWAIWLLTLGIVFGALGLIWQSLPGGGYSTDLTQVGQGAPVGVLTHETANPTSMQIMDWLDEKRSEVPGRMRFIVADLGTPAGREFAQRHEADTAGMLLLFDSSGELQQVLAPPEDAAQIDKAAREVAGQAASSH